MILQKIVFCRASHETHTMNRSYEKIAIIFTPLLFTLVAWVSILNYCLYRTNVNHDRDTAVLENKYKILSDQFTDLEKWQLEVFRSDGLKCTMTIMPDARLLTGYHSKPIQHGQSN